MSRVQGFYDLDVADHPEKAQDEAFSRVSPTSPRKVKPKHAVYLDQYDDENDP